MIDSPSFYLNRSIVPALLVKGMGYGGLRHMLRAIISLKNKKVNIVHKIV